MKNIIILVLSCICSVSFYGMIIMSKNIREDVIPKFGNNWYTCREVKVNVE